MSDKMTCPACNTHTSNVSNSVVAGLPCPYCELPADVITEVLATRERLANTELAEKYEQALIRAGKAEAALDAANDKLYRVRCALEEGE